MRAAQPSPRAGASGALPWLSSFGRLIKFPHLDLNVTTPVKPDRRQQVKEAARVLAEQARDTRTAFERTTDRLKAERAAGWPGVVR